MNSLVRPRSDRSDVTPVGRPKKVAWIQCVGWRDGTHNRNFCSSVCCMAAVKQAIITRDHDAESEAAIFYMDMRAHGKDFDRYVARAKDNYGVRFVPSMISQIIQNPVNRNLSIQYYDRDTLEFRQEELDLVVLSTGMKPSATGMSLMRRLGIEQRTATASRYRTRCFRPTRRARAFLCAAP